MYSVKKNNFMKNMDYLPVILHRAFQLYYIDGLW